jgi:RNA polymerase sigma factor (sigma-70 family)
MALSLRRQSGTTLSDTAAHTDIVDDAAQEVRLVRRAQAGDRDAFEALVHATAERLYAVVLRFVADPQEAEEVTQEAFLRAWRGIGSFDGRSRFLAWLYRIGGNEAKRQGAWRSARPQQVPIDDHPVEDRPDGEAAPEHRAEAADRRRILDDGLRRLPEQYRIPIVLRDIEGLSTRAAADLLGIRERAFKSRLHRARLALRSNVATAPSTTTRRWPGDVAVAARADHARPPLHARVRLGVHRRGACRPAAPACRAPHRDLPAVPAPDRDAHADRRRRARPARGAPAGSERPNRWPPARGRNERSTMSWVEEAADAARPPNVLSSHSLNQAALRAHVGLYRQIMFGPSGLSRAEREAVAVRVSAVHGCHY